MNQDQQELTLHESVKQVMQTLPPVIRTYLSQGKYTEVAKSLMAKYRLRVDQGGVLEREIMLLLMGIENPDEFIQSLTEEAQLDPKIIEGIVQDVNTQIFLPLREGLRRNEAGTSQPKPLMPQSHSQSAIPQSVTNVPSPAAARINTAAIPQANAARPMAQPQQQPPAFNTAPMRPQQTIGTPRQITSNRTLEDHEEPHIEFKKSPVLVQQGFAQRNTMPPSIPVSPPARPANVPQGRSFAPPLQSPTYSHPENKFPSASSRENMPPKASPPPNLPGMMQSGVISPGGRPNFSATPKIEPSPSAIPSVVPPKSYSSDPYREPIDEK